MTRALRGMVVLVVLTAFAAPLMALNVVNTSAPAVNYVFSPTGSVSVTDMTSPVLTNGFLQSRIFQGQPGSPAAGKWVYEYRLDLRNVVGILSIPYVTDVAIPFGTPRSYDYNFDGNATDQVFVISSGGMGTKGLSGATTWGSYIFFTFAGNVYGGGSPGNGESSYFWGVVSDYAPVVKTGYVYHDSGYQTVSVYAPNIP